MIRFRRFLSLTALLVAAAVFGAPSQANAAFLIRYSTDGGATFSAAISDNSAGDNNSKVGTISIDIGGVQLTAQTAGSTATGKTSIDVQIQSVLSGPVTAGTLIVQATMTDLVTQPAPQALTNKFNDTSFGSVSVSARTWIDQGNAQFGTTGGGIKLDTGNLAPNTKTSFGFSATPLYSITSQIDASYLADASLGYDSNDVIVATPAPAGLVAAITGIPVLGLGTWIRRRRNRVAA